MNLSLAWAASDSRVIGMAEVFEAKMPFPAKGSTPRMTLANLTPHRLDHQVAPANRLVIEGVTDP